MTCKGEGEGAVEKKFEVSSLVTSKDSEATNRGRENSHWNRYKSKIIVSTVRHLRRQDHLLLEFVYQEFFYNYVVITFFFKKIFFCLRRSKRRRRLCY